MGSFLVAALLGGCGQSTSHGSSGALQIIVQSDLSIPKDIDHVHLTAAQEGRTLLAVDREVGPEQLLLPATFGVSATGNAAPVSIKGVAFKSGQALIERDAVTTIPSDRVGQLFLPLNYLCVGSAIDEADGGVSSTCPQGLTCSQGACVTSVVTPTSPPPGSATPAPASGDGGSGADAGQASECFDVEACLASATPATVDTTACTVTAPAGSAANLNVALAFAPGGPGICGPNACWVVLTDWTLSGGQIQLPAAACAMATAQHGTAVVSTACATETDSLPPCGPWSSATVPVVEPGPSPLGQSCVASTRSCGMCGTQVQSCENGVATGWLACANEGVCAPETSQGCDLVGGTETCGANCQWGACTCPAGQQGCAGACVATTDAKHCGGCGHDCTALPHVQGDVTCASGQCVLGPSACAQGFAHCSANADDGCEADISQSAQCGGCGKACASSLPDCSAADGGYACTSDCAAGTPTLCGGSCVDTTTNVSNCGACGAGCTTMVQHAQARCVARACSWACNAGYTSCGGACVGETTDPANCGACGNACASGTCTAGQCTCAGSATQTCGNCGAGTETRTCSNETWSAWSACSGGGACAPGATQTCGANAIQTCGASCGWGPCLCANGYSSCGAACVDETKDPANCGACGNKCPSGSACQSGSCTCTGASSQSCGNCGIETRTCDNGVWSAWSTSCIDQGVCAPGSTESCAGGGSQTCSSSCQWGGHCPTVFMPSGSAQSFVVPSGVTSLTITAIGGVGGSDGIGAPGGYGAQVTFTIAVTAGQTFRAYVGDLSGGRGGQTSPGWNGSAGGSGTEVDGPSAEVVVAGGGGGAGAGYDCECGGGPGGNGGTPNADDGGAATSIANGDGLGGGGGGATTSGNGAGGQSVGATNIGYDGSGSGGGPGGGNAGGGGGSAGGGGGGGGYYGGGGGGAGYYGTSAYGSGGGGGGGSSWVISSATSVSMQVATSTSAEVIISY